MRPGRGGRRAKPVGTAGATSPARFRAAFVLAAALALIVPAAAQAAGPPQIAAAWTTEVAATSAQLHAEIDPEGAATAYRFDYLTEAAYRENIDQSREPFAGALRAPASSEPSIGSGTAALSVHQSIGGLEPDTAYRYRVLAASECEPIAHPGLKCTSLGEAHAFTTEEIAAVFSLPDRRGWEMVSPIDKNGGAVQGPGQNFGGDVLQAAAGGGELTYSSASSFAAGQGAPAASQYMAGREASGWSTQNLTAPQSSGAEPQPGAGVPFRLFSADLSSALIFSGGECLAPGEGCANPSPPLAGSGAPAGYQNYYLRNDATGAYQALITAADAPELHDLSPEAFSVTLAGATPDLRHVVLSTCAKLTPEATEQPDCESGGPNLYEWSEGALRLLNLLGGDAHGTSDAHLAAQAGAISSDGSRVYFTVGEEAELFLREGESGAKPVSLAPAVQFQTASADGQIAFYTKGEALYRYDAATEASEPLATEVRGVLGASQDGSRLYYLTASGLYLWTAPGTTTQIAPGAPAAFADDYPPTTGTARTSADGTHLAFLSTASLTGYDNTDQSTGKPDSEVFLYAAAPGGGEGTLACASCNPTGERPLGPSTIPGAIANGTGQGATDSYKPRDLSADASRLFFDSADSLVLSDTDGQPDVYQWEAPGAGTCGQGSALNSGCVSLISSGRDGADPSEFIDASAEGGDVFFLTAASLVPTDPGSFDLYDAREGGGFPVPPSPIECDGDACQPLPSEPEDPTPGTLTPGEGNPPVHFSAERHHKPHHRKHRRKRRANRHRGGRG